MRKLALVSSTLVVTTSLTILSYVGLAYANIPVISDLRDIYIETAMTTGEHQWLATDIFPKELIDRVMSKQITNPDIIVRTDIQTPTTQSVIVDTPTMSLPADDNPVKETPVISFPNKDILHQRDLTVGDLDQAGNKILVNDVEQGIIFSEVSGTTFKGKLTLIDDPSRVFIGTTDNKGIQGRHILDLLTMNDAVVGINANGFPDDNGVGLGGTPIGLTYSQGEPWGKLVDFYGTIAFDQHNRLIVGDVRDWDAYAIRDGAQFTPPIIADGKNLMEGSGGWGLHPRTLVGQRSDGVVIFLVIDGRQPGYSLGATMGDCAELLLKYGAVTAGACDGGSSSIMAYDNKIMNRCSSPSKNGRLLPNAFLVKRK